MSTIRSSLLIVLAMSLLSARIAIAITKGQLDHFQTGTQQGWNIGILGTGTSDVAAAPPGGFGLACTSGFVSGGGLPLAPLIINQAQWSGNYIAAGVTGIELDIRSPVANSDRFIRIAIVDSTRNSGYSSTTGFSVPGGAGWFHAFFSLSATELTAINSPPPLNDLLANVFELRILHANSPSLSGDNAGNGVLTHFDNIRAVPEPSTICLAASAAIAFVWFRRRSKLAVA